MVLVIGSGVSGNFLKFVLEKMGREVKIIDFFGEEDKVEIIKKAELVVLSSSIKDDFFKENKINYLSEIDFVCANLKKEYIFITGTKGKGTTALFLKKILEEFGFKVFLGGNISAYVKGEKIQNPAAMAILADNEVDIHIFEVSSFQLRSTRFAKPLIHAVINIYPDHLDWHPTFEDYKMSKLKIGERAKYFIVPKEIYEKEKDILPKKNLIVFEKLNLDEYFSENLSLALKIFEIIVYEKIKNKLPKQNFAFEEEGYFIYNGKRVRIINDAKSTTPYSMKKSLKFLKKNAKDIVLITGGIPKTEIKKDFFIEKTIFLKKSPFENEIVAEDIKTAIKKALDMVEDDGTIIFSPYGTSFDMFLSATERGEKFKEEIRNLEKEKIIFRFK